MLPKRRRDGGGGADAESPVGEYFIETLRAAGVLLGTKNRLRDHLARALELLA